MSRCRSSPSAICLLSSILMVVKKRVKRKKIVKISKKKQGKLTSKDKKYEKQEELSSLLREIKEELAPLPHVLTVLGTILQSEGSDVDEL
ncbi:MAG: hypothetical protein JSW00_09470 [Thermoplasmata archaeon]|nr:MAG: hypothetical protein JSW00_09470 [Thermoplasmata archaeon]